MAKNKKKDLSATDARLMSLSPCPLQGLMFPFSFFFLGTVRGENSMSRLFRDLSRVGSRRDDDDSPRKSFATRYRE